MLNAVSSLVAGGRHVLRAPVAEAGPAESSRTQLEVDRLLGNLSNSDRFYREAAVLEIGEGGLKDSEIKRAIPILIAILHNDTDEFVRASAAQTLGKIGRGNESVISELKKALEVETNHPKLKRYIEAALQAI